MREELIKEHDKLLEEIEEVMVKAVNSEEYIVWHRLGYLQGVLNKVKELLDKKEK